MVPQVAHAAKAGVVASRKALSSLYSALVENVEAELGAALTSPDLSEDAVAQLSKFVEEQAVVMQALIRTFRLFDGVGAALCRSAAARGCQLMQAWACAMTAAGFPGLASYTTLPTRSCAVDMIVSLVLLAKVRPLGSVALPSSWRHLAPRPHPWFPRG